MGKIVYSVSRQRAKNAEGYEAMFVMDGLLYKGVIIEIEEVVKDVFYFATIRIIDGLNKLVCTDTKNIVWVKKSRWHTRLEKLYKNGTYVEVQSNDSNKR